MKTRPRLLPWSESGKPAYLRTSDPNSMLSRLADEMEEAQLGIGESVLAAAKGILSDPKASASELRFTAARLSECLFDALRVATSRGARLTDADEEDDSPVDDAGPTAQDPSRRCEGGKNDGRIPADGR
ncbi:hypothetical protein [Streptomyces xinghaiensis]|uniref:hypothetical protein n=1 Tax=Streptomyces xinghaiensis TaxID=1038928 RepID=UPI0002FF1901|nr:hypothetical protein [Streptomyces xinghaiensis]